MLIAAFVLAACGGGDTNAVPQAQLRVLHASPDAPNVDVYVDGAKVLANVPYPTVSQYFSVPAGQHRIQVDAAGTTTTAITANVTLASGTNYSAVAIGSVKTAGTNPLALKLLTDG